MEEKADVNERREAKPVLNNTRDVMDINNI